LLNAAVGRKEPKPPRPFPAKASPEHGDPFGREEPLCERTVPHADLDLGLGLGHRYIRTQ
jgi:hypothetical protein